MKIFILMGRELEKENTQKSDHIDQRTQDFLNEINFQKLDDGEQAFIVSSLQNTL